MVTIILGGQIGSEGKGKVSAYLSFEHEMSIRSGGPNSGHTVNYKNSSNVMQLIPCSFVNPNCLLAMSAGSLIIPKLILKEITELNIAENRILIDNNAGIIEERHIAAEKDMLKHLLSTGKGVGFAHADKALRKSDFRLAKDVPELQKYLATVEEIANNFIDNGKRVMIEGTQGFDLSVHHGHYPYVTSRDTTAGSFIGEVGISPRKVSNIVMVLRAYPIRASNGPLYNETTWDNVTKSSGALREIKEVTSVTKRLRRVGLFDEELVEKSIRINRPTQIALNFVDYLNSNDYKINNYSILSDTSKKFIDKIENLYNVPVTLIGTGPNVEDIIDLRSEKGVLHG
ncbi:adenylosuccinate synthetase [Tissierella sp. P1]|uniref:adenylosuccinate synthetase n=1 Tax=Tissierella sp. P1 TaxID=1280483 RepID=UPI001303AB38|nr:adenylosuccinate synthetase [Tissierella sp. P1]